jgi:hypothetical protein
MKFVEDWITSFLNKYVYPYVENIDSSQLEFNGGESSYHLIPSSDLYINDPVEITEPTEQPTCTNFTTS